MARQFTRAPICASECRANDGRIKCGPCLRHNADLQGISCIECWDAGVIEWKDEYCTCAKGDCERGIIAAANQIFDDALVRHLRAITRCDCPGCSAPRTNRAPASPMASAIAFSNPSRAIEKRMGAAMWVGQ